MNFMRSFRLTVIVVAFVVCLAFAAWFLRATSYPVSLSMKLALLALSCGLAYAMSRLGKMASRRQADHNLPLVRFPTSLRQALWGGNTCRKCGCDFDKWGRELSTSAK